MPRTCAHSAQLGQRRLHVCVNSGGIGAILWSLRISSKLKFSRFVRQRLFCAPPVGNHQEISPHALIIEFQGLVCFEQMSPIIRLISLSLITFFQDRRGSTFILAKICSKSCSLAGQKTQPATFAACCWTMRQVYWSSRC
jgi:hypothetical protein